MASSDDIFSPEAQPKSETLKVLTVLTFIGCGFIYIATIWGQVAYNYEAQKEQFEKIADSSSGFMKGVAESGLKNLEITHQYRFQLLAATLIFTTLCLVGAIMMRKLKKSGFYVYLVGEIAPVILNFAMFGFALGTGFTAVVTGLGILIPVIFIILYSTQLKYLR